MNTIIDQIKSSTRRSIRADLLAGITIAIMVVPQGMAYAMLAGLPPVYGLYAALIPLIVYPLFGTSRQLSVGPVALMSIIVLEGISPLAVPGTPEFIELVFLTGLIAGLLQILLAILRMGFLVNFLSEPVIKGFTSAAAIIIGVSQLKYLFGLQLGRSTSIVDTMRELVANIGETNIYTLAVGILGIVIILGLRKIHKAIPGALIAVVVSGLIVYFLNWHDKGVEVVGVVQKGLPTFRMVPLHVDQITQVLPLAGIICLISFIESLAIAKTIAARHQNYRIDANRELLALGLSKSIGSIFQAFPPTGSFTRSAVNDEAGATTGLSSIFAALVVILTLLFFTPLFFYLPNPTLAATVIAAVVSLIDFREAKRLFKVYRTDFYVLITTFILTLILGVQQGVFAGIILSVIMILYKTSRPHYAVLGQLAGTQTYRNIKRYPEARPHPNYLIIRYDVDIYFGNADHFYDTIMREVKKAPDVSYIIINAAAIGSIDSTGLHKLGLLLQALEGLGIKLLLAGARGEVRDALVKSGLQDKIGRDNCYLTIHDALVGSQSSEGHDLSRKYATQHNVKNPD